MQKKPVLSLWRAFGWAAVLLGASACAPLPRATPHAAPAAPSAAGAPPAFAALTEGAHRLPGLLTLWQKEDKVWIELKPEDFGKPFFFSPKISRGIGESGFYGGSMASRSLAWGAPQLVEFRRVHRSVQLIALNSGVRADKDTPAAYAVASAYSSSLVGSAAVASQPAPGSQAVLVEANAIFLTDVLGMGINLQRSYHQNYAFDTRNSSFGQVRALPDEIVLDVDAHFATSSVTVPGPGTPAGAAAPSWPGDLPDARSLFLGLHYSIAKLPDQVMHPRAADARVGYFTTTVADFSDDRARNPRLRWVNHWRLEKKDPAAALSEPVKPITYWLDRDIPVKYREAIRRGILEWNKAFERIGLRDAIVVRQQADDATFDTLDFGSASVRWMVNLQPSFGAIGPTHVDPRSGEILDAGIAIESLSSRGLRAQRVQVLGGAAADFSRLMQGAPTAASPATGRDPLACELADYAAEQLDYALDLRAAQALSDPAPDSPEVERFVQAYLTDVAMHEVGHTLGLRHNFRASRLYTEAQLSDPEFTRTHALTGSVMEYAPVNLPDPARAGRPGGTPFQTTLGPYDYWAIEYAYKPLPAGQNAAEEAAALRRIAGRGTEPELAYGTDEDSALGLDPEALQFDLGADPIAFAAKRFAIARDLFQRQEHRPLSPEADYSVLRRSLGYALRDTARSAGVLLRQLGGVRTLRDAPGSGRDPMQPVAPAVQRQALDLLADGLMSPDNFRVSPALQRHLAPDFLERADAARGGETVSTDYPVDELVLDFQRTLLAQLMSDDVAERLLDAAPKLDRPAAAVTPGEIYARIARTLWTDAAAGTPETLVRRRELQRSHVNLLAAMLLRTPRDARVDMRAELRAQARALLPRIEAARRGAASHDPATAVHLADCADTLRLALAAPMARSGY